MCMCVCVCERERERERERDGGKEGERKGRGERKADNILLFTNGPACPLSSSAASRKPQTCSWGAWALVLPLPQDVSGPIKSYHFSATVQ